MRARLRSLPGVRVFFDPRIVVPALVLVLAGVLVVHGEAIRAAAGTQADFHDITDSVRVMLSGQNPYQPLDVAPSNVSTFGPTHSNYPPTAYVLLAPLTLVSGAVADIGWVVLNDFLLVGVVVIVYLGIGRPRLAEGLVVAILLAAFLPVVHNLVWGQFNLVVLFLVVLAVLAHQRGHPVLGGVALGAAVAIKLAPIALLPYFIWKRNWPLAAVTLVTLAVVVAITLLLGWEQRWLLYYEFLGPSGRGTALQTNQSVNGMLLRLVRPDLNGYPIGPLPPGFVPAWYAVNALVLGVLLWSLRRIRAASAMATWTEVSIILLVLPVVQPIAWIAHHVFAIVAIVIAVRLVRTRALPAVAVFGLAVAYLLSTPVAVVIIQLRDGALSWDPVPRALFLVSSSALVLAVVLAVWCLGRVRGGSDRLTMA